MKRHERLLFLFALLLPISSALGQAWDDQTANDLPQQIAAARCAYAAKDACAPATPGTHDGGNTVVAQLPRRGPGPAFGPRGPMGRPAYSGMWGQPEPSGRHVLVGAAIGALVGVALGAKGNAGARGTFGLSALCAGIGAGMGASVPSFPSRNPYFRRWPDDDDAEASGRKSAKPGRTPPGTPQQTSSLDATSARPRPNAEDAPTPRAVPLP